MIFPKFINSIEPSPFQRQHTSLSRMITEFLKRKAERSGAKNPWSAERNREILRGTLNIVNELMDEMVIFFE